MRQDDGRQTIKRLCPRKRGDGLDVERERERDEISTDSLVFMIAIYVYHELMDSAKNKRESDRERRRGRSKRLYWS